MSDRRCAQHFVAWVAAIMMGLLAAGAGPALAQPSVGANGPIAIDEPGNAEPRSADDAPPGGEVIVEETRADDEMRPGSHDSAARDLTQSPPIESKQLGPLNEPLTDRARASSTDSNTMSPLGGQSNEMTRVLGALGVVIGLILIVRVVMRRAGGILSGGGRPSGVLEILARYPIGRGQQLLLLKVSRRIVLLHQSGSSMTALSEMSEPDEVAALLSRMEAGASERDAAKFKRTFSEYMAEQDDDRHTTTPHQRDWPPTETEVVDLTRRSSKGIGSLFGWRGTR